MKPWLLLAPGLLLLLTFACGDEEEALPAQSATSSPPQTAGPTDAVPSATSPDVTPIEPQGWKTFTNTKYGYSLEIPSNWLIDPAAVVDETTSDYVDIYNYHPPETGHGGSLPPEFVKIELVALANPKRLPLDKWVEEYRTSADAGTSVISSSDTMADGLRVIKETVSFAEYPESASKAAFVGFDDFVLLVNGPQADTPYVDTYEEILGSVSRIQ